MLYFNEADAKTVSHRNAQTAMINAMWESESMDIFIPSTVKRISHVKTNPLLKRVVLSMRQYIVIFAYFLVKN